MWEMKKNVSVVRFKFRCNILISGKITKEMPGSNTPYLKQNGSPSIPQETTLNNRVPLIIIIRENSHIGHFTLTSESTNVKVQNIVHTQN